MYCHTSLTVVFQAQCDNFREMYGRDAQYVDVTNVTAVASTMNKKFLQKS